MSEVKRKTAKNEAFLFENFIVEKEASGLSKKSIDNYREVYARFVREMAQKVSKNSIYGWIRLMLDNKMNPISINFYINQIRVFAYWLMRNGYCERFEIKKLKAQEPQIKTMSDGEIMTLLEKPNIKSSFRTFRSWTVINFILGTGARASTVINLKVEDIDFSCKEIRYSHLKNKKAAIVPMSHLLERVLKTYLNMWDIGGSYLFPDIHGGQLTLTALEQSIRKYCIAKGVKHKGVHAFRHTFAKKYIINGGNAFSLQRILTHTDLTMTKKYVHLFSSDLKLNYDQKCPLDSYQRKTEMIKRRGNC